MWYMRKLNQAVVMAAMLCGCTPPPPGIDDHAPPVPLVGGTMRIVAVNTFTGAVGFGQLSMTFAGRYRDKLRAEECTIAQYADAVPRCLPLSSSVPMPTADFLDGSCTMPAVASSPGACGAPATHPKYTSTTWDFVGTCPLQHLITLYPVMGETESDVVCHLADGACSCAVSPGVVWYTVGPALDGNAFAEMYTATY